MCGTVLRHGIKLSMATWGLIAFLPLGKIKVVIHQRRVLSRLYRKICEILNRFEVRRTALREGDQNHGTENDFERTQEGEVSVTCYHSDCCQFDLEKKLPDVVGDISFEVQP